MSKKTNPRSRPASEADILKARKQAHDHAITLAWSIFFTVLRDKEGYTLDDLKRVWREVEDLSDSVTKGYCSVDDLRAVLEQEIGAMLLGQ